MKTKSSPQNEKKIVLTEDIKRDIKSVFDDLKKGEEFSFIQGSTLVIGCRLNIDKKTDELNVFVANNYDWKFKYVKRKKEVTPND